MLLFLSLSIILLYPQQEGYKVELDPTPSVVEEKVIDDTEFKYAVYDLEKFGEILIFQLHNIRIDSYELFKETFELSFSKLF